MSKTRQPESPVALTGIEAAADAAEQRVRAATPEDRISDLETKIAGLEPLLEQLQASSKIGPSLTSYVNDLRDEQVFFNRARYGVGCISGTVVIGLIGILSLALFNGASPLLKAPPVAIATFVIGLVSGIVFLLSAFVKGVFRSTAERHSDGFLPPALEKSMEFLGKIVGKS